ncbi:hypothetical protein NE865_16459 [Phthorimaea operculella]|nr:hypothetical protein NE865_16459 [Phthorimaea operculella]
MPENVDDNEVDVATRLKELTRQRGTVKGKLTLFQKFVKAIDKNTIDSIQKLQLLMRIDAAKDMYKEFDHLQTSIDMLVDDNELVNQTSYREEFESNYYSTVASAKYLVEEEKPLQATASPPPPPLHSHHCPMSKPVSIKLPDIKLPAFDGSYDQWLEFRNSYVTMIHARKDLDSIQKFHYLKSSLSGSALQVSLPLENPFLLLASRQQIFVYVATRIASSEAFHKSANVQVSEHAGHTSVLRQMCSAYCHSICCTFRLLPQDDRQEMVALAEKYSVAVHDGNASDGVLRCTRMVDKVQDRDRYQQTTKVPKVSLHGDHGRYEEDSNCSLRSHAGSTAASPVCQAGGSCGCSKFRSLLRERTKNEHITYWTGIEDCRQAREAMPTLSSHLSKKLLRLKKPQLRMTTSIIVTITLSNTFQSNELLQVVFAEHAWKKKKLLPKWCYTAKRWQHTRKSTSKSGQSRGTR